MTSLNSSLVSHSTFLLGHRGARGEQLENSKAGFLHTQRLSHESQGKLVGIEFDVQLTKDGKLVVFHDDDLQRLYSRQSRVDQCTLKEIQRISQNPIASAPDKPYLLGATKTVSKDRAINHRIHPVLLLQDMPNFLHHYRHIELEIKTHQRTDYSKLINALQTSLAEPGLSELAITLTSFDVHLLYLLQNHPVLNQYKRGLLVEPKSEDTAKQLAITKVDEISSKIDSHGLMSTTGEPLSQTVNIALRLQCQSIGLYYPLFDPSIITACKKYGLNTTAWTVNSIDDAKYLIQIGVDYLISDYPSYFLRNL